MVPVDLDVPRCNLLNPVWPWYLHRCAGVSFYPSSIYPVLHRNLHASMDESTDKCMAPVNGSKGLFSFDSLPPGVALSVLQVLHDCLAGSSSLVLSGRSKGIQQEIARGIRRSVQRCRELQRCTELLWLLMTSYDFLDLFHLVSSCFPVWVSNCGRCGRAGGILQLEFVKPRRLPSISKRSSWQFWCRPLAWTDTACFMS